MRVARTLGELHACLKGEAPWPEVPEPAPPSTEPDTDEPLDLADVRGLAHARLALAAAAAGGHHFLMVGPPGVGKTMLARRLPTILPDLDRAEALEVTRIHSAAGLGSLSTLRTRPPFRAPHHSASSGRAGRRRQRASASRRGHASRIAASCSSTRCRSSRRTCWKRSASRSRSGWCESAGRRARSSCRRTSCWSGARTRARAGGSSATAGAATRTACATPAACRRRLLDRFDLRLRIEAPGEEVGPSSAQVRARVETALRRQRHRLEGTSWRRNAHIPAGALAAAVPLAGDAHSAWVDACRLRRLTGRGAARIRRVARTLADLDDRECVSADDVVRASWLREDVW